MAFLKSAETHIKEGVKHLQEKEYEKALNSFQQAEKKKPQDPGILNYISQTYAVMDDLDNASKYILRAITLQPEVVVHSQLYATYLMRQGKNDAAIPVIDEVLEKQPTGVIYILRGQADYNLGNIEESLVFFDKALELDTKNPLANHMKGLVLYKLKRYAEAIPYIEIALSYGEEEHLRSILVDCLTRVK
jgi:tetratricopeptide (TPR) repeat protein